MVARLERAEPVHAPGAASGYHGISFSWLIGGLVQRLSGRPISRVLQERLVAPLGLDGAYFGLPEHELDRCAELVSSRERMNVAHRVLGVAHPLVHALSRGKLGLDDLRAALVLPASQPLCWNDPRLRRACVPSSTGVFTARSFARMYAALAGDGSIDGVRLVSPGTVRMLRELQSSEDERDRVTGVSSQWRRGLGAFAVPDRELAFAFLHNARSSLDPMGGARFQRLARVALACAS
jgi:CubicO group peptidase (beta-lactamase class C family)